MVVVAVVTAAVAVWIMVIGTIVVVVHAVAGVVVFAIAVVRMAGWLCKLGQTSRNGAKPPQLALIDWIPFQTRQFLEREDVPVRAIHEQTTET